MTLTETAAAVMKLRFDLLVEDDKALTPVANQHLLIALAQLEQAACSLRLAELHEAREMGHARMGIK